MKITQKWLSDKNACSEGVDWFAGCGETSSFKVLAKLRSEKHWSWFNWLIVRLMDKPQRVRYAIFAAQQALPIFEKRRPNDDRPRKAIEAAQNWVEHQTEENRNAATSAADAADYADAADAADAASASAARNIIADYGIKILKEKKLA